MNSKHTCSGPLFMRTALTLLLFCAPRIILNAQGYIYSFVGTGASELDRSFIVLSANVADPPSISNLAGASILDSYGSGAVFDILAPPNSVSGFAVTSFGPAGFSGEITCEMFGYLGVPSTVVLSGNPAGISYSRNLFFPGNPAGGSISGSWVVAAIPEPHSILLAVLGAAAFCGFQWRRTKAL